jgi:hypothetical protein
MNGLPRGPWLPRLLFRLTMGVAALLVLAIVICPWLDAGSSRPRGRELVVAVFARDATVRRTAFGAAAGLVVTACAFFRQPGAGRSRRRPPAPPRNIAGA